MWSHLLSLVCPALAATRTYFIRHVPSGYCLDVWGFPGLEVDTPASLWECEFGKAGSDHACVYEGGMFRNQMNGLCLDVAGSNAANEATVQVDACLTLEAKSGTPTDQTWNLQPASGEDNGTYLINGAAPGRCLTVWAEDFIPAAWIVNQDCEFNRSNRASQLWELVEVCKLENSNAYNKPVRPHASGVTTSRTTSVCRARLDNVHKTTNVGRAFPTSSGISLMRCDYCPDGKEVADDMVSCKDETFLGLTEIQWAAIGTGLAACSILAGAFLTLCRCCKTDGDKQTPSPSPTTSEIPVVQAVQIGSRPVSEGTSPQQGGR